MKNPTNITPDTLAYFLLLADDARNWEGQPLFEGFDKEKGYLLNMKKLNLLHTFTDEGCTFVIFEPAGVALAAEHGIDLTYWYS